MTATHCPSGHAYDEANTYTKRKRRYCRTCRRARNRVDIQRARDADKAREARWRADLPAIVRDADLLASGQRPLGQNTPVE